MFVFMKLILPVTPGRNSQNQKNITGFWELRLILLINSFHLSKDGFATLQYNFSFHDSMGGSHTYKVSRLAISTCQLLAELLGTLSLVDR